MTDSNNEDLRFEYCGPAPNFPLLVDRDTRKTAKNDAERLQLEAEGYQAPSPGWPPIGWTTGYRPRNDSPDAIRQWFDCQSQALCLHEQQQDAGNENLNSLDVNGNPQDATDLVRDAYLLVKALEKKGWPSPSTEPCGRVSFRDARIELENLFDWIAANIHANVTTTHKAASLPDLNAEATAKSDRPAPAQQDAFDAFVYAREKEGNPKLTPKEAFDFWTDPKRGFAAEDRDEFPQLVGYDPGKFSSYKTNLSKARNHPAINQPEYDGKRKGNLTGQTRRNGRKMIGDDGE